MTVEWGRAAVKVELSGDPVLSTWISRAKREERSEWLLGALGLGLLAALVGAVTTITIVLV